MKNFRTITATISFSIALTVAAEARSETLACRTLRGPCQFLDTVAVLFPGGAPTLVANFGFVFADDTNQWRFACEASLDGLVARARMAPSGAIFLTGARGLIRYQPRCTSTSFGAIAGASALDVAIDGQDERRLWLLGEAPRAVYRSSDGGAHFTTSFTFAPGDSPFRLLPAPSRPDSLYAAGERADGRFLLLRSDDGGASFASAGDAAPEGVPLDLYVHPSRPEELFLAVRAPDGADALWRSDDAGNRWARALALPPPAIFAAFSFGPSGDTVFVGARQPFADPAAPAAELYVSRDGGRSFSPAAISGPRGPRYRCLAHHGGLLYACAGGTPNGDDFLLGVSRDEGRTWTPLLAAEGLAGPEPCRAAACAETSRWLCDTYGLCGRDGGVGDAATSVNSNGGCACGVSRRSQPPAYFVFVLVLVLGLYSAAAGRRPASRSSA